MSSTIAKRLVINALLMAVDRRKPAKNLLFHSDQGLPLKIINFC
ncbi:hypothetical protein wVul_1553 [Wolbachia endosymbiont of Armadillidium vulgare str. wVulC]|nr:hypothetical protein wVul_1553 [Wolbachia endosymbiont of Armadillidium vulgare str. wVulC]